MVKQETKQIKGFEKHEDGLLDLMIENKKKQIEESRKQLQPSKDYRRKK